MNKYQTMVIVGLLMMVAMPQGLSAMERNPQGTEEQKTSWKDLLFSKKSLAFVGTAGLGTWLTWSDARTQQFRSVIDSATNNKGKVAGGLVLAALSVGLINKFSQKSEEPAPVQAAGQWRDAGESAASPSIPALESLDTIPVQEGVTAGMSEHEGPPGGNESTAAAQQDMPQWLKMFIELSTELYRDVELAQRQEVFLSIAAIAKKDPFDLIQRPDFISRLTTNRHKALFIYILSQYVEDFFTQKLTFLFDENQRDILDALPQDAGELLAGLMNNERLRQDQKDYLVLVFQQMAEYQNETDVFIDALGISPATIREELQALFTAAQR